MDDAAPLAKADPRFTSYDHDVLIWSREQAALLRDGRFSELDIEHIADEVEDVGKSEQNELVNRTAILLAHLLKWKLQPQRRGTSWLFTIREQRKKVARRLRRTPSLKADFGDEEWLAEAWADALSIIILETDLVEMPEACIWTRDEILDPEFLPE